MDLVLERRKFTNYGVFSQLYDATNHVVAVTLEHAYLGENGYEPKIPSGVYSCVRGTHCLHNGVPFETFEITGVAGHSNLLFHAGNFNNDSEGCVLVGDNIVANGSTEMITDSKITFKKFMQMQEGVSEFTLTVR